MSLFNRKHKNEDYDSDDYMDSDDYLESYEEYDDDNEDVYSDYDYSSKKKHKIKNKSLNRLSNFRENDEEVYDENNYCDYEYSINETENEENKINVKNIISMIAVFLYCILLIIGVANTTFLEGYKPQIITPKIKSERVVYHKVENEIDKIEKLDTFKGVSELKEIYENKNFQSRIPPLKDSLNTINKEIEDMNTATYKVKQDDYINVEMFDMAKDLLQTQKETLTQAIKFYESMSGYSTTTDALKKSQADLLNQYQIYNNKLANYKSRLEQIKLYDLKLE